MRGLAQNVKYAVRGLLRSPSFAATAVLTIAIGIGATTVILSIANAVFVKGLPFDRADELYSITKVSVQGVSVGLSVPEFKEWQAHNRSFDRLAGFTVMDFNVRGNRPESILGVWASQDFLETLGIALKNGRSFVPGDFQPGAHRVAIVSRDLWKRRYAGRTEISDEYIDLEGPHFLTESVGRYAIVGVLPEGFWLFHPRGADVIVPMRASPVQLADRKQELVGSVIGRLTGTTFQQARADLTDISGRFLANESVPDEKPLLVKIVGLREAHFGDIRSPLLLLMGAVCLMTLIASTNVGLILLAKASARRRELAIRAALGAGRVRLVCEQLTESLLLFLCGGAVGIFLSAWGTRLTAALLPGRILDRMPGGAESLVMDGRVLAAAAIGTILLGSLVGLIPVFGRPSRDLSHDLSTRRSNWKRGRQLTLQGTMVVAEIALAVVLLLGAGLLLKTLGHLQRVDLGIKPTRGLVVWVNLNLSRYPEEVDRVRFYRQVIERISTRPQIRAVSGIDLPFIFSWQTVRFHLEGQPPMPDLALPHTLDRSVTPNYFKTHGIRSVQGRLFNDQDDGRSTPVAIVSHAFTRQASSSGNVLGKRIRLMRGPQDVRYATIVGIVSDIRTKPQADPQPIVYRPYEQHAPPWMYLTVEGTTQSTTLLEQVRAAVWDVDPDQPLDGPSGPWTLTGWTSELTAQPRLLAFLANVFAAIALVLTMIGLYGVLAYQSSRRTMEFGIRVALGATHGHILWLVTRQALILVTIGTGLGLLSASALTRYVEGMLFGIEGNDPMTFAQVVVLAFLVACFASWIPAMRAMSVEPVVALRSE